MSFEKETAFSPESTAGSSIVRSQLQWKSFLRFEEEAQIVGGVLELAMVLKAFPTTERYRV